MQDFKNIKNSVPIFGYASTKNYMDANRDIIKDGAFKDLDIKKTKPILLLLEHDFQKVVGLITEAIEDEIGLYIEGFIEEKNHDLKIMIKKGIIKGLSIGYTPLKYEIDHYNNCRIIDKLFLHEISVVTIPSNDKAQIFLNL